MNRGNNGNNKWIDLLKVIGILTVTAFVINHFFSSKYKNPTEQISEVQNNPYDPIQQDINDGEINLFGDIKNKYKEKKYLDLQFLAENFYKEYKMSEKMDSVEVMYEEALDSLEARELREEGSLAFKRYKLNENPILNPNPKMSASAEEFLNRFVGKGSDFAKLVKDQLRESDSFEYIETKYLDKKSGYIALVMRFRANNGFGQLIEREAIGKFDKISETFTDIKIRD